MPRALARGERTASLGVILGLVAVMCLLIASLGLTLAYRDELKDTRNTLKQRCTTTEAFRNAVRSWHEATIRAESRNPFIDESLRAQRLDASSRVITAIDEANAQSCADAYKDVNLP